MFFLAFKSGLCFSAGFRYVQETVFPPCWASLKFLRFEHDTPQEFQALETMALHALWICRTLKVKAAPGLKTAWLLFKKRTQWVLNAVNQTPEEKKEQLATC